MKRTPLRKTSKNPIKKLKTKADRLLQDYYRAKYPDKKCEVCGNPFELCHHHVEKSKSNLLRYKEPLNLIFLCKKCHNALHFGVYNVVSIYTLKRGKKWERKLQKLSQDHIVLTENYLNNIIKYYDNKLSRLRENTGNKKR